MEEGATQGPHGYHVRYCFDARPFWGRDILFYSVLSTRSVTASEMHFKIHAHVFGRGQEAQELSCTGPWSVLLMGMRGWKGCAKWFRQDERMSRVIVRDNITFRPDA